ncbi:tRNA 2-selenouridine(34) synthase MnmH [Helicobacter sp. 10-6591]|uniref:tRNA 2-selenouridine(34) synthase MnmH n=1 Tax=Helicobacter sp. 10-6591 TaxID=2004998 RepID=UPI00215D2D6E|nr:tRNA 2-selenouridine(34) synthase MnmH [Helicobacter sp. 10-6591]
MLAHDFLAQADVIFDVRSPSEFASSHIVGARNVPVLDDNEREQVGKLYKQDPFGAKVLGATLICKNISQVLCTLGITPAQVIGIYCARGGMRSLSLQSILQNIGYRTLRLTNGYKAYRKEVLEFLAKPLDSQFFTLSGPTGCGKSTLIGMYEHSLDIESLSMHLGSSFGGICGQQPRAAMFENLLFARLRELEGKKILVENESKKLGSLVVPSMIYNAYKNGVKILITAPLQIRIQRILEQYGDIDLDFFNHAMQKIAPFMDKRYWLQAHKAFELRDLEQVAYILITQYYDKVYRKEPCAFHIDSTNLESAFEHIRQIIATH